ncbi:MAG: glycosyltransferase [Spirochaetia bacterium]|nr:glycosyltransferase [Spirochaetia bacterium]
MIQSKLLDVVIISYAKDDYCRALTTNCINSLIASENNSLDLFNIIVVESEPEINWEHLAENVKTYPAPLPYGYHKFLNFGRKMGNSPWVALCNNDLIFKDGWFTSIIEASAHLPDFMSFSPMCPMTQPLYGIRENNGVIEGYEIRKHISGWCIVHKREIYNIIGELDERFHHWFCDNDYAMELVANGLRHALVTESIVEHHDNNIGKTTERVVKDYDLMYRMTSGSYPIFKEKWSL